MNKLKKVIKLSLISLIVLVGIVIGFISPLTKYLVEKYDTHYLGREVKLNWVYVNPFTGYIYLDQVKIFEQESDTIFFSAEGLSANFAMRKLLFKTVEVSELSIDAPIALVSQNKLKFNFSDLITKFSSTDSSKEKKNPLNLNILNIKIKNGTFYYRELVTPINYFIKKVNIESEGYRWNVDSIPIKFSFLAGLGSGAIKGDFTINPKNRDYSLAVLIHKYDLNIVGQYIKDLSNYGSFKAFLDADFKSKGNLMNSKYVTNSGQITISDFRFGKDSLEDFVAFEKLNVVIKEISPANFKYSFDSISLNHPYFKYEKYDYLDNVQTMFGKQGVNVKQANSDETKFNLVIEIAKYMKTMSRNLLKSNYKINRLAIYDGEIKYNDYSLGEKFTIDLKSFNFIADSVDKTLKRVACKVNSDIQPYGDLAIGISMNPKDSSDFDLNFHIQNVPVSMFNPYFIKFTSFPLDRGTLEIKGAWHVRNGQISSTNHVMVIDPRIGEKSNNNNANWLPLRFAMFFVRERSNVIDYEVPIVGNLKNPKFKLKDVILDAVENIFVKPATTAYRVTVKNAETEVEKSLSLKWEMRNASLTSSQQKFLKRLANFLHENPETTIIISPQQYEIKEKEFIVLYEAKKKYFESLKSSTTKSYDKDDSLQVEQMSIKDSSFINYLNKMVPNSMLFTVQDKCIQLIGKAKVVSEFNVLRKTRRKVFIDYFKENAIADRVKILKEETTVPYNGYSFYKISYKGDFPNYLIKAYNKMNELNNEAPRNKFKRRRKSLGA